MLQKRWILTLALSVLSALSMSARAALVQFDLDTLVNTPNLVNQTPTATSPQPVGTLRFTDTAPQAVQLLISSSLEVPGEALREVLFNGTFSDNTALVFTPIAFTGAFTPVNPAVLESNNGLDAGGIPSGFDFLVPFSAAGGTAARFDLTDSITYLITCGNAIVCGAGGSNPLDATDFIDVNFPVANPNLNGFFAVGRINFFDPATGAVISNQGSRYGDRDGAFLVPEPGSFALLGVAFVVLGMTRRRSKA